MQPSLKVLHLTSSVEGGAGLAARRLNRALVKHGIDSNLLTLSKVSISESEEQSVDRNLFGLFLGKLNSFLAGRISSRTFFSIFSVNSLSAKSVGGWLKPGEGIVHIHNWFNFISIQTIGELIELGYKIVITLHDERMFTGGCHYALNCSQFAGSCSSCPELIRPFHGLIRSSHARSFRIFHDSRESIVIVAPSRWIEAQARNSTILQNSKVLYIQNTLGTFYESQAFSTSSKKEKSDSSKIQIGIASKDPYSYIKGGDLIVSINNQAEFQRDYQFVFMADFSDEDKHSFWKAIDFLFVPSRMDNSPNVIHEAKSLGIPVIGSKVGGIPELLDTQVDFLVEPEDLEFFFLSDQKEAIFGKVFDSAILLRKKEEFRRWSEDSVTSHIEMYQDLLRR